MIKGVFASDQNIMGTQQNSFNASILRVMPTGSAPLFAMSAGMKSIDVSSYIATWYEQDHLAGLLDIVNNAGVGDTLIFADASEIVPNRIMLIQDTGEYCFVSAVVNNTVTVKRGLGNGIIIAIDGSVTPVTCQLITNAHEEGSPKPTSVAQIGSPRTNLHQIIRDPWDATATAKAITYKTGDVVKKNKSDAGIFHAENHERAYLWGIASRGTNNGKPFRTMDGVTRQIKTNIFAQTGSTTSKNINDFFQAVFAKNVSGYPNERIGFCGSTVLSVIGEIAENIGHINLAPGQTDIGMEITTWRTVHGVVKLYSHPLMNENPTWSKELYLLHPAAIEIEYLRRTFLDDNDKAGTRAGVDADYGVYTTESCIKYMAEMTGGVYTGIDVAG